MYMESKSAINPETSTRQELLVALELRENQITDIARAVGHCIDRLELSDRISIHDDIVMSSGWDESLRRQLLDGIERGRTEEVRGVYRPSSLTSKRFLALLNGVEE